MLYGFIFIAVVMAVVGIVRPDLIHPLLPVAITILYVGIMIWGNYSIVKRDYQTYLTLTKISSFHAGDVIALQALYTPMEREISNM